MNINFCFFDYLETEYTVIVQTGSVMGAGTDANVFLSLYGDKNKIVRYQLKKPQSERDLFERDHKDDFVFEDNDIGRVSFIDFL